AVEGDAARVRPGRVVLRAVVRRVHDERVVAARAAVDRAGQAAARLDDERVVVVGRAGEGLEAGEADAGDGAAVGADDAPGRVRGRAAQRVRGAARAEPGDAGEADAGDAAARDRAGAGSVERPVGRRRRGRDR